MTIDISNIHYLFYIFHNYENHENCAHKNIRLSTDMIRYVQGSVDILRNEV